MSAEEATIGRWREFASTHKNKVFLVVFGAIWTPVAIHLGEYWLLAIAAPALGIGLAQILRYGGRSTGSQGGSS